MKRKSTSRIRIWAYVGIISLVWMNALCMAAPLAPLLAVSLQGETAGLSWTQVLGADGYRLLYAPYPDAEYIDEADLGNVTEISFQLWPQAAFFVAVQAYDATGSSEFSNIEHFTVDSDDEGAGAVTLSLTAHPDNTLMAVADIETGSEASVYIEFSADNVAAHQTAATARATRHEIVVAGMRAEAAYSLKAVAVFEDGSQKTSEPLSFTTGALPQGAPAVTLLTNSAESTGGITFLGIGPGNQEASDSPVYWGVDEEGMIVWYLHGDLLASGSPFARGGASGELLTFNQDSILTVNSAGETLAEYNLQPAGRYHHDAALLPNGNVMTLVTETGTFDNEVLAGDRIVELSPDGRVVWEWSGFEHLDTTRFPGSLSRNETRSGGLDWSHANALHYIAEEDALLLSLRSQNWVVKIDHATGKILWILGDATGTAEGFDGNFFTLTEGTWMTSQHAPLVTSDGDILLYDNRNDSGGSTLNSRAVKYTLDESNMTAAQTWESTAPKYTSSLGDVDELAGKNVLICAGGPSSFGPGSDATAHIKVVTSDTPSEAVWEITVNNTIYRAERLSWSDFLGSAR